MSSLGIGIFKRSPKWFLHVANFEKHCSKASKSICLPLYPHFQNRASHIVNPQITVNSIIDWMGQVKLITVFPEILRSQGLWTSRDRGWFTSEEEWSSPLLWPQPDPSGSWATLPCSPHLGPSNLHPRAEVPECRAGWQPFLLCPKCSRQDTRAWAWQS